MKTKLEKKDFISEIKNVLKVRDQLLTMREIVLNVARRFDGKVYNKRFDNTAKEELKKVNDWVRIETEHRNPSKYNGHDYPVVEVRIILRTDKWNYDKYESLSFHLALVDNIQSVSSSNKTFEINRDTPHFVYIIFLNHFQKIIKALADREKELAKECEDALKDVACVTIE